MEQYILINWHHLAGNLWAQNREMLNKYRGDLNEGLSTNTNVNHPNSINRAINFFTILEVSLEMQMPLVRLIHDS